MIVILLLIGLPVMTGIITCRWTRMHPLTLGLLTMVSGGIATFMALAGIVGVDVVRVAPVIALFPGAAGALGGFLGWLRRTHLERMNG